MPNTTLQLPVPAPLTTFAEDEILFRDNIRQFAEDKVRPLVKEMDEKGVFDHDLIQQFFQLGLMGIEIPEQYGGGGGKFFEAILAVEEMSRVDASAGVIVDVQNTLVNNALLRWANEEQKKRYLPRMASDTCGAYALSEAGAGSDAFALQKRHRHPERRPDRNRRADGWSSSRRLGIRRQICAGAQAVWQNHRRFSGYPIPDRANGHRNRSRTLNGLQRRPNERCRRAIRKRSRHDQAFLLAGSRAGHVIGY